MSLFMVQRTEPNYIKWSGVIWMMPMRFSAALRNRANWPGNKTSISYGIAYYQVRFVSLWVLLYPPHRRCRMANGIGLCFGVFCTCFYAMRKRSTGPIVCAHTDKIKIPVIQNIYLSAGFAFVQMSIGHF